MEESAAAGPMEIKELLQCPVCFGQPRPDSSGVGLCPNGHYTCHKCTLEMQKTMFGCPSCRVKPVTLHPIHHFVNSVISMFTSTTQYLCKHEGCEMLMPGSTLVDHERVCPFNPVPCHKQLCDFMAPITKYLNNEHECFTPIPMMEVGPSNSCDSKWQFKIPIVEFYSVDRNTSECSFDFKLRFLSHPEKKSQAYLNFTNYNEAVIFYVGWIGKLQRSQYKSYKLYIYANNHIGSIGGHFKGPFKFHQEQVTSDRDGLYVSQRTMLQWVQWVDVLHQQTHVHVEISLEK